YPDAILILEFGIDTETEIGWIPDPERGLRLEQRAWKEEAQEHYEVHAQESQDGRHHETPAACDLFAFVRVIGSGENLGQRLTDPNFGRFGCFRRRRSGAGRFFSGRIRHVFPRDPAQGSSLSLISDPVV